MENVLLSVMAMLLGALLLQRLAARWRLPFGALLVVSGFLGSELIVAFGGDTGLRWYHFHGLILNVLVPVLIFEAALRMDVAALRAKLVAISVLAGPLMILSAVGIASLLYVVIAHPGGFPWATALVAGVLLSATDPAAVITLLKGTRVPEQITTLLEGESLFNDATAIVLFSVVLAMAVEPGTVGPMSALGRFIWMLAGGLLGGALVGLAGCWLLRLFPASTPAALVTLLAAYFSFAVAELALHASPVMAVLACGLVLGRSLRQLPAAPVAREFWLLAAYIAEVLLFLLMGVTITTAMFAERWLAMLAGVAAVLLSRGLIVYGLPPWRRSAGALSAGERGLLAWGGVRGAVTLALALSLPFELTGWWTVQSIAYGVVVVSLFLQVPTIPLLLRRLGYAGKGESG
jgi:CPA1 family monovalent cation:H+ antiporter